MASRFHWMQRAVDHVDLMDEIIPGQTVVEVIGEGRVLVEGHDGVSEYSDSEVSVKVSFGVAKICGCNLKLTQMSGYKLVISGQVDALQFLRRPRI